MYIVLQLVFSSDTAGMSVPSWLKPNDNGPEFSFEELRHKYMFPRMKGKRKSIKEIQQMSIGERKLEILDLLLSVDEIRPIVIKLVCLCTQFICTLYTVL